MISMILPYRERGNSIELLKYTIAWMKKQLPKDSEIIIAEDDKQISALSGVSLSIMGVFNKNVGLFHKTKVINMAVQMASGEILLLHDADILPAEGYVSALLEKFEQGYETVHLGREVRWLVEKDNMKILKEGADPFSFEPWRSNMTFKGGSLAITAEAFRRIGGMNEEFIGHGGEDTSFYAIVKGATKFIQERRFDMAHLFHPKTLGHCNMPIRRAEGGMTIEERVAKNVAAYERNYGQ